MAMTATEPIYTVVDAMYRLHDDLFRIEAEVTRAQQLSVGLARIRTTGMMGALVAGLLVIVPILTTLANMSFTSMAAIFVYAIAVGLGALWLYQVREAKQAERQLGSLAAYHTRLELKERPDYMLESVNAYSVRARLLEQILAELDKALEATADEQEADKREKRRSRYVAIRDYCDDKVRAVVDASDSALRDRKRSPEQHKQLENWARPRLEARASRVDAGRTL